MNRTRLEAFSDGVLAIIITIMVLEIKVPHGNDFEALKPLIPVVISYILSFIYIGIYWNNHHHLMHTVKNVTGGMLWANLHLLFWLSLVPFTTGWIGENHFDPIPMAIYGFVLLMAAIGSDLKGKMSVIIYLLAIGSNFASQWISGSLYILVALIWLIPDKRIEIILRSENEPSKK